MAQTNSKQNYLAKIGFKKSLSLFLTCLPPLLLICFAIKYTVNIPFSDEWYFVPLFEKMFNHTLTFNDLWAQHNEHRFLITKLITLANVQLTGWDLKYEIYLNVIIGLSIFFVLTTFLKKEAAKFNRLSVYWIFPLISILIFSLTQAENWLWGIQMNIFLCTLFVLTGFIELAGTLSWKPIFFASVLGIMATYSNSGGLLFWPTALIIIYFHPRVLKNLKYKIIFYWVFIATIVILSYFYNYKTPQYGLLPTGGPVQILTKFAYQTLAILGSALEIFSKKIAALFGLLGLSLYLHLLVRAKISSQNSSPLFLSQLALSLYAICNVIIISLSRLKFDLSQEQLATRYGLSSSLFWISTVILLFLNANFKAKKKLIHMSLIFLIMFVVSIFAVKSSLQGMQVGTGRQLFLRTIQDKVFYDEPFSKKLVVLVNTYPLQAVEGLGNVVDSKALSDALNILSKHNLSIFK